MHCATVAVIIVKAEIISSPFITNRWIIMSLPSLPSVL